MSEDGISSFKSRNLQGTYVGYVGSMKNLETEENIGKYKIVYSCKSKKYFSCEKPFKTLQEIKLHIQENHRHENIDIYGLTNVPLEKNEKSGRYREISKNSEMSKKPTYTTNNEGQVFLETTEFNKINFTTEDNKSNNSLVKHLKHPLPKENLSKSEISPGMNISHENLNFSGIDSKISKPFRIKKKSEDRLK